MVLQQFDIKITAIRTPKCCTQNSCREIVFKSMQKLFVNQDKLPAENMPPCSSIGSLLFLKFRNLQILNRNLRILNRNLRILDRNLRILDRNLRILNRNLRILCRNLRTLKKSCRDPYFFFLLGSVFS